MQFLNFCLYYYKTSFKEDLKCYVATANLVRAEIIYYYENSVIMPKMVIFFSDTLVINFVGVGKSPTLPGRQIYQRNLPKRLLRIMKVIARERHSN